MADFTDAFTEFNLKVEARARAAFAGIVAETANSIVLGSELTGSPGQPVDTGNLRDSWQTNFESPDVAMIGTNVEYAKSIVDGLSYAHGGTPMTLRSAVGGFHSVAQTVAGFPAIVESEAAKVAK